MNIYSIYKITNSVNGKVYIGYTVNIIRRLKDHQKAKRNLVFYNAIQKHGWDKFSCEIIYQSFDSDHTLNVMEPYFIKEYNSFIDFENSNGYNATLGGGKNIVHTLKSLQKMSDRTKLQWKDSIFRNNIISRNKTKWKDPAFLNTISKKWQITTPAGEIAECINMAEFCRQHSLDNGCMTAVSKGDRPQHKGYTCKRINA